MLDINFIRENLELVKAGAKKKHIDIDLSKLISIDDARRALLRRRPALYRSRHVV